MSTELLQIEKPITGFMKALVAKQVRVDADCADIYKLKPIKHEPDVVNK